MLANKYRFHGHGSLRYVYAKGKVTRSKYFLCKSTLNRRRSEPRIAVVISKKILKSAVKRNRVRRRMYEAIRLELPKISEPCDIVFIVISPELLTATVEDIQGALTGCLSGADLYKQPES